MLQLAMHVHEGGVSTNFAVALGKVQVADGEFAAFDVDGHVRLAAP